LSSDIFMNLLSSLGKPYLSYDGASYDILGYVFSSFIYIRREINCNLAELSMV